MGAAGIGLQHIPGVGVFAGFFLLIEGIHGLLVAHKEMVFANFLNQVCFGHGIAYGAFYADEVHLDA